MIINIETNGIHLGDECEKIMRPLRKLDSLNLDQIDVFVSKDSSDLSHTSELTAYRDRTKYFSCQSTRDLPTSMSLAVTRLLGEIEEENSAA